MEWALQEFADQLGAEGRFEGSAKGFCIDSRRLEPGGVFFAFKGENFDGHNFLEEVAKRGGKAAVVSKGYQGQDFGLQLLRVEDVLKAVQNLAQQRLKKRFAQVIGVTGSVGKTTTKEFLATLLETSFSLYKSPLSYNSQVTVPINLLNAPQNAQLLILEMAMSSRGELERLVEIAPVDFAVITKIGHSHTAFFPDGIEGVAGAKAEIFSSPKLKCALAPYEALCFEPIARHAPLTFGHPEADFFLMKGKMGVHIVEQGKKSPELLPPFNAEHLLWDFMAAAAMARQLGVPWEKIQERAPFLKTAPKRFEVIEREGVTFVVDCYNASLESTLAALNNLPCAKPGGKVRFVFGEMRELGAFSKEHHEKVGAAAAERIDHALCLGAACAPIIERVQRRGKKAEGYEDMQSLKRSLFEVTTKGDVVLIKGANSHELWRLLD